MCVCVFVCVHARARAHARACNVTSKMQGSKLRVLPAPWVHILAAGCMDLKPCAPGVCMNIFNIINDFIQKCTYEKIAGCMVLSITRCVYGIIP